MLKNILVSLFALLFLSSHAQQTMAEYIGTWVGQTIDKDALNLKVLIEKPSGEDLSFQIRPYLWFNTTIKPIDHNKA